MRRILAVPGIVVLGLVACATTHLTSTKDASAEGRTFGRFVVDASFRDQALGTATERAFAARLAERGIPAIPGSELLPPTREYPQSTIDGALLLIRADATLVLAVTPVAKDGSDPGPSAPKPRVRREATVFDVLNGGRLWRAVSTADAKALHEFDSFLASWASEVVARLEQDRLIVSSPPVTGVVDYRQAIDSVCEGKAVKATLQQELDRKQGALNAGKAELDALGAELASRGASRTDVERTRAAELDRRAAELRALLETYKRELSEHEAAATRDIFARLDRVSRLVAMKLGCTGFVERQSRGATGRFRDITREVVAHYDRAYPVDGCEAAPMADLDGRPEGKSGRDATSP